MKKTKREKQDKIYTDIMFCKKCGTRNDIHIIACPMCNSSTKILKAKRQKYEDIALLIFGWLLVVSSLISALSTIVFAIFSLYYRPVLKMTTYNTKIAKKLFKVALIIGLLRLIVNLVSVLVGIKPANIFNIIF